MAGPKAATRPAAPAVPPLRLRRYGLVNWAGTLALALRGLKIFAKDPLTHVGGPLVSGGLFLVVFLLAGGGAWGNSGGGGEGGAGESLSLLRYIGPGMAAFMLAYHAFEMVAALLIMDKMEGVIGDFLQAPLTPAEVLAGYLLGGAVSALLLFAPVLIMVLLVTGMGIAQPLAALGYALLGALLFSALGVVVGLWAERWEHFSAVENFSLLPLGMLSGAFFSLETLSEPLQIAARLNPIHHLVEGMRWSVAGGPAEPGLALGSLVLVALVIAVSLLAWRLMAAGYHIKD